MKKEKSPLVVVITIFFLSLFIILPPTFRAIIPDETAELKKSSTKTSAPPLSIVTCNKTFGTEMYQVVSRTKYVNGKPNTNTIRYQKLTTLPKGEDTEAIPDGSAPTVSDELTYFKSIPNLNITDNGNLVIVTIDATIVNNNPTETTLKQYFNNTSTKQKNYYENMGYKCNVMDS